ncbi:MAG: hypothetical protein ACXU9G_04225, partial [Syntrophales bacterium]
MVLMLRCLREDSGGLSVWGVGARCGSLPECKGGKKHRFSANLKMSLNEELRKRCLVSDAFCRG